MTKHLPDLLCLLGVLLVAGALWLVYPPLAIAAVGLLLISAGVMIYRQRHDRGPAVQPDQPPE